MAARHSEYKLQPVARDNLKSEAKILMNGKVSIQLRLRLFDAVVTPTILYGLAILPLSTSLLDEIEVAQRKMLRKIVGWVRVNEETWDSTMRRMKFRVNHALQQRPIMAWSERIAKQLWKMILRVKESPSESWINETSMWVVNECDDPCILFKNRDNLVVVRCFHPRKLIK